MKPTVCAIDIELSDRALSWPAANSSAHEQFDEIERGDSKSRAAP
jgi:hypothetical protein